MIIMHDQIKPRGIKKSSTPAADKSQVWKLFCEAMMMILMLHLLAE